jgi:hypothetical protein
MAALALAWGGIGGGAGLAIAVGQEAHLHIAGTPAEVRTTTQNYNQLSIDDKVIQLKIPAGSKQNVAGQQVGVNVNLDVDLSQFITPEGKFNTPALTAYGSLFSDTKQIESDVESALLWHDGKGLAIGALAGIASYGAYRGSKAWLQARSRACPEDAAAARRLIAPLTTSGRRVATAMALTGLASLAPSSVAHAPVPAAIHADAAFEDTALEGAEIDGTLAPVVHLVETAIAGQVASTGKYYDAVVNRLNESVKANPILLPQGDTIKNFVFTTDRHCNDGIDREIVDLGTLIRAQTLVSGGDDAFSGSFPFESGCTSDIAERAKKARLRALFIGGNHDSPMTLADERKQGITVLQDDIVTQDGINFIGEADPRTSRYGQGLRPSSEAAQTKLLLAQGKRIGAIACKAKKPVIAILHDKRAGDAALANGCGYVRAALDGHTHVEAGPVTSILPDGSIGEQFTGGSAGGAPNEQEADEANPFQHLTVGKLEHNAYMYVVSVDTATGDLAAITGVKTTPEQTVTSYQAYSDTRFLLQPLAAGAEGPLVRASTSPVASTK